jgi:1-acyl-sn-glycerol-3-phosphate acyltransferase
MRWAEQSVLIVRSLLFNTAFYAVTAVMAVVCLPVLLAPRSWAMVPFRWHARCCSWLLSMICGVRYDIRGRDHIPVGPALIASKHQSAWETFGLVPLLPDPCYVMKAELGRIPLYGAYSRKFGMILVARDRQAAALRDLLAQAKDRIANGRQIIIFPEATRREPGAPPAYKPGVIALYEALGVPCVPVALNSGLVWPRRQFLRHPGTIVVEFLPPIPPGLTRAQFSRQLQQQIESAATTLLAAPSDKV